MSLSLPAFSADRLVHLAGVTIGTSEPVPETLRFHLQTRPGDEIEVNLHMVLSALAFATRQGVVPALPRSWYNQVWLMQGIRPPW